MLQMIKWDYLSKGMCEVVIPVGKKYRIVLNIKDVYLDEKDGLYPSSMYIFCDDKNITDLIIRRNADMAINPNAYNVKTAIDLIEELEYKMAVEKEEANNEKSS